MSERKNKSYDFDRYADLKKNVIQFHAGLFTLDQNFSMFSKFVIFFPSEVDIFRDLPRASSVNGISIHISVCSRAIYVNEKKTTSNNAFNGFLCLIVDHERSRNDF